VKLAAALRRSHKEGALTEDAARIAMDIARGYMIKLQASKGWPFYVVDDGMGAFVDRLVRKWQNINPDANPRGYCMRMASSSVYDQLRKYDAVRRRDEKIEKNQDKNPTFPFDYDVETVLKRAGVKNGSHLSLEGRRKVREEGLRLIAAGVKTMQIVRTIGVSRRTVANWRRNNE